MNRIYILLFISFLNVIFISCSKFQNSEYPRRETPQEKKGTGNGEDAVSCLLKETGFENSEPSELKQVATGVLRFARKCQANEIDVLHFGKYLSLKYQHINNK